MNYSEYYEETLDELKDYVFKNELSYSPEELSSIMENVQDTIYPRSRSLAKSSVAEAVWDGDIRSMLNDLGKDVLIYYIEKDDPVGLDLTIRSLMLGECCQEFSTWWKEQD